MKKVITKFLPIMLVCLMITVFTTTAYAAPDDNNQSNYEDYINDFVDSVNSALNDFENNNRNYFDSDDDSTNSTDGNIATEPVTNATERYVPTYDEEPTEYTIYEQETVPYEESTYEEESTVMVEADENEDYDYSYTPPTEEPTEEYQPEILTETYTDPPFLERFAITDEEKGNLFIALGLWASIIIGIIIVLSVVISTHRRKKGS